MISFRRVLPVAHATALTVLQAIFVIVGIFNANSFFYCMTGFFGYTCLKAYSRTHCLSRNMTMCVYFSPYVFPIFSYSSTGTDLRDETHVGIALYKFLGGGMAWGVAMAVLTQPVELGVVVICGFLLAIIVVTALFVQIIPLQLGSAAHFVTDKMIIDAANMARETAAKRREDFELRNQEWEDTDEAANDEWQTALGAMLSVPKIKQSKTLPPATMSQMIGDKEVSRHKMTTRGKQVVRTMQY